MCTQWGEAQPGPTMESAPCFHVLDPSVPLGSWARGWEAQIWELLSWVTTPPGRWQGWDSNLDSVPLGDLSAGPREI